MASRSVSSIPMFIFTAIPSRWCPDRPDHGQRVTPTIHGSQVSPKGFARRGRILFARKRSQVAGGWGITIHRRLQLEGRHRDRSWRILAVINLGLQEVVWVV